MNSIKRSLTMGLLLLTAAVTSTAENVFSIQDTTVIKSGDTPQTITLELALENTDTITGLQFDLTFPEGLELQEGSVQLNADRILNEHELKMAKQADATWRFLVISKDNGNKPLVKNTGTLISLPVRIADGFTSGQPTMTNVVLTDRKGNGLSYSAELGLVTLQEKLKQSLKIFGLEQVVNPEKAAVISWEPKNVIPTPTVSYYTNETCTTEADETARKSSGTFYAIIEFGGNDEYYALKDTVTMVVNNKKPVDFGVKGTVLPTATTILQGQSLSASILSGGKALIASATDTLPLPGTFAWRDGNEPATVTGKYTITFSPEDNANYATKDTTIDLTVIPVYTVLVNNPENGSISATGISSNNRYAEGQELFLKAIPNTNYRFSKWSNGVTTDTTTWMVQKDGTISAAFTEITHKVTFEVVGNGEFSIKTADGKTVTSGSDVQQGTELLITLEPGYDETNDKEYILESLVLNDKAFVSGKYILGEDDVKFVATFVEAENESPVIVNETKNGVIRLYKADGTAIPSGTAMKDGETFKVMALANAGYQLEQLLIDEEEVNPDVGETNIFTGTTDGGALIEATFAPKMYKLSLQANNGTVTVKDGNNELSDGSDIAYGSTITIESATANEDYTFRSLVVNGRKVEAPAEITVGSDINIAATFEELTTIKDSYIINAKQSYTFNNQDKRFFIYTTQTYATGFNIAYSKVNGAEVAPINGIPVKAGTYNMSITRPADEIYKEYKSGDNYFDGKLEIKKAKIAVKVAPTADEEGKKGETSVASDVKVEKVEGNDKLKKFIYTPKDADNYEGTTYYLSTGTKTTITAGNSIWYHKSEDTGLKSARIMTKAGEEALAGGYIKVSNGGLAYAPEENGSFSIEEGTTLTLEAIPDEGFQFTGWSDGGSKTLTKEVTVTNGLVLPTAHFAPKGNPTASLTSKSSVYNSLTQEVSTKLENAQISIYKDRECNHIAELKNAGEYWISIYRPATDTENEVRDTVAYTITPAQPTVVAPTTMEIAEGETLAQVQLLGGNAGSVPGTFSWKDSTATVSAGEQSYTALFTSADPNYASTTEVQVTVNGLSVKSTTDPDPDPTPDPDPDPTPDPDPDPDPEDPDQPTSIEEIASETLLVVQKGALEIHPCVPVETAVISINGKYLFNGKIQDITTVRIPHPGIYIVTFIQDGKAVSRKVRVL